MLSQEATNLINKKSSSILLPHVMFPSHCWKVICSFGMFAGPKTPSTTNLDPGGIEYGAKPMSTIVVLHFLVFRFNMYSVFCNKKRNLCS